MGYDFSHCTLCPRACGADRTRGAGVCGEGSDLRVAKVMLHFFEEPPISGTRGSGAVFFYGCNLKCGFCQNAAISRDAGNKGKTDPDGLAATMLALQERGAHNINLVTAAHFVPQVAESLQKAKPRLRIPVVYNSSGYERVETLRMLDGLVDIYLPDYKYTSAEAALRYSGAADYPRVAAAAIAEMLRQTAPWREENGLLKSGVLIRHLVLPGQSRDGEATMQYIAAHFPDARVSILRQYTPDFNKTGDKNLDRRITSLEYNRVLNAARAAGLKGYMQDRASASAAFTPSFSE